jgi:hypothetical protein
MPTRFFVPTPVSWDSFKLRASNFVHVWSASVSQKIKKWYNLVNLDWIDGPCRPVPFSLLHPLCSIEGYYLSLSLSLSLSLFLSPFNNASVSDPALTYPLHRAVAVHWMNTTFFKQFLMKPLTSLICSLNAVFPGLKMWDTLACATAIFLTHFIISVAVLEDVPPDAGLQNRATISTLNVGLAGTGNRTRATCMASSGTTR